MTDPADGHLFYPVSLDVAGRPCLVVGGGTAAARKAIAGASDEQLLKPWSLVKDGKAIFTQPRVGVLRGFILNHAIHHRGQLGVYLRLNDVPVPSIYGPSADEGVF